MNLPVIIFGLVFFLGGVLYLINPSVISAVNEWMRENVFSDRYLLLYRKKIGLVLILLGVLFLYCGLHSG